jgi:hypothetical protein
MSLPHTTRTFDLERFRQYLSEAGAELMEPTNQYEVVRYRWLGYVQIVYRNERGILRWMQQTADHYRAMMERRGLSISNGRTRLKSSRKPEIRDALTERDGTSCFFCEDPMVFGVPDDRKSATIEHLWPASAGGPNTRNNLVLVCFDCNQKLGDLPLVEKLKILKEMCHAKD